MKFEKYIEESSWLLKRWDKYIGSGQFLWVVLFVLIGVILSFPLIWPTNTVSFNKGMGADSDGRIYIGEKQWIGVYQNGELVDKFVQRVRGNNYEFAVVGDQIHLWDTSNFRKILDMQGNAVDKVYDKRGTYALGYREKHEFTADDGRYYELKNGLLRRAKVTCYHPDGSEEIVFQMSMWLYLSKLVFLTYMSGLMIWLIRALARYKRREAERYADLYKY